MNNHSIFFLTLALCPIFLPHAYGQEVGIGTEDPTETLDVNGSIRMREGASIGMVLVSDSLGTASWSTLAAAWDQYLFCVTDFGAISEDGQDDTWAFQIALDSASAVGAKVCVPPGLFQLTSTLEIPAGVIIEGTSPGHDPLIAPYKGSVIEYTGTDWAIKMKYSNAGLRDLAIRDAQGQAAGGIYIFADSNMVESLQFTRVQVYGFVAGTGIYMGASNEKGVAYSSFYDVRVRHAKIGIHIKPEGTGFVNSNSFYHGAVSGGGFDYCLLVEGGTRNELIGTVMEPFSTTFSHVKVEGGQLVGRGVWIEGNLQPIDRPLIEFSEGTTGSMVEGSYAGGLIVNKGSNTIKFSSSNSLVESDPGHNILENPIFAGVDSIDIPNWSFTNTAIGVESEDPALLPGFHVLKFKIPPGQMTFFGPDALSLPQVLDLPKYSHANFGGYIKTDQPSRAFVTLNPDAGMITSIPHWGDDEWQFVGLRGETPSGVISPRFFFDNTTGIDSAVIYLSCPTFSFGNNQPILEAKPLTSAGAEFNGVLSYAMRTAETPANHFLVLPRSGNIFEIDGTSYISRINHLGDDRFTKGTVITLLFNETNVTVINSAYVQLTGTFVSTTNSSLTLVSNGNGTWREINRNL